jgi:hypothetical protein
MTIDVGLGLATDDAAYRKVELQKIEHPIRGRPLLNLSEGAMAQGIIWRRISLFTLSLWLSLFVLELIVSFYLCNDRLVFTLDDPYIHLAVADHILSGGYGVNGSEFSSPSSSIIWPYLLALTEALHLGACGPLLINTVIAFATVFALLRFLETIGLLDDRRERPFSYVIAVLGIFFTSAIALPMTGMEHSFHVWASIVTLTGLVEAASGRAPRGIHLAALVLLPLVRFEGMAFALAAIGGFAVLGHRRFAGLAAVTILCAFGAYFALMASRGLPLLPSSVLLKSRIAGDVYERTSAFGSVLHHLITNLLNPYGSRLTLLGLAIACGAWLLRADRKALTICAAVLAAIGAHLAFGENDWFHRYEVYAIALGALGLVYVATQARPLLNAAQWTAARTTIVLLTAYASTPYVMAALKTPLASRNIYEQQYQMSLFAQQLYNRPVAVNDLGLVAYKNPNFVLDLWGLGSEKVRKAKLAGQYGPDEIAALADEYHVGLVMIYDSWFLQGLPASWKKVAILHTDQVTAALGDVAFYTTPAADAGEIVKALTAFKTLLPARDRLDIAIPLEPS